MIEKPTAFYDVVFHSSFLLIGHLLDGAVCCHRILKGETSDVPVICYHDIKLTVCFPSPAHTHCS